MATVERGLPLTIEDTGTQGHDSQIFRCFMIYQASLRAIAASKAASGKLAYREAIAQDGALADNP